MRKAHKTLAIGAVIIIVLTLAGCSGGGQPTDGGWLAKVANWALFLQLSGTQGTADYAVAASGQVTHDHTNFVQVNNGNVIVFGMTQFDYGMHGGGCGDGCEYDISGNTLTLHATRCDNTNANCKDFPIALTSASASDFDQAVKDLKQP